MFYWMVMRFWNLESICAFAGVHSPPTATSSLRSHGKHNHIHSIIIISINCDTADIGECRMHTHDSRQTDKTDSKFIVSSKIKFDWR